MHPLIRLMRPHQYVKNTFVFLPLFFAGRLLEADRLLLAGIAFAAFCATCSAIYVLNDIMDREEDASHPVKRQRPLASGAVGMATAVPLALLLLVAAAVLGAMLPGWSPLAILGAYVVNNVAYSLSLKKKSIVDVLSIALGFVLRLVMGGVACGVMLSHWIILLTFLLATFLALGKRWDDLCLTSRDECIKPRKSLDGYNKAFVAAAMQFMASVMTVCYLLYSVSPDIELRYGQHFYLTGAWVVAGVMRYFQITLVHERSGSPTRQLFTDRPLQLALAGWFAHIMLTIYV